MKKAIVLVLVAITLVTVSIQEAEALFKSTKFTIVAINDQGVPLSGVNVGVGFEKNTGWGTDSSGQNGITDADGRLSFSGQSNGHITYGGRKNDYYDSYYDYDFNKLGAFGWEPWNPDLKIVMRKIENPVPMYARDTKFSKIKIPVVGKDIGFDLIKCDWVEPYGKGEYSDFFVNLTSMVENVNNYDFTATIKFEGYNGFIKYIEDVTNGSQYKLPRFAPESGYEKILKTYDRTEKEKNRDVSWSINQHYMFRVRSVVDKNNKFEKAMHGKIVGDIHLGPQRDGTAYIEFKYYLNPDYTRNLEFDPKRNLFGNLPKLEQVNEP